MVVLLGRARLLGAFYFDQLSAGYVIHVAIDGNCFRNQRMVAKPVHVVHDRLLRVRDGEPFDELPGARAGTFADVAETAGVRSAVSRL